MVIFGICIAVLLGMIVIVNFVIEGVKMCKKNDGLGIFLLFLCLNVVGLILGISLLYNARNGSYILKEETMVDNKEIKGETI